MKGQLVLFNEKRSMHMKTVNLAVIMGEARF